MERYLPKAAQVSPAHLGLSFDEPRTPLVQLCYDELQKLSTINEPALRESLGLHFLSLDQQVPAEVKQGEYFLKQTGIAEYTLHLSDQRMLVSGHVPRILFEVSALRYLQAVRWLEGVKTDLLLMDRIDDLGDDYDWSHVPLMLRHDSDSHSFYLSYQSPEDLSLIEQKLDLDTIWSIEELSQSIRKKVYDRSDRLLQEIENIVQDPFDLEPTVSGYFLIHKRSKEELRALCYGKDTFHRVKESLQYSDRITQECTQFSLHIEEIRREGSGDISVSGSLSQDQRLERAFEFSHLSLEELSLGLKALSWLRSIQEKTCISDSRFGPKRLNTLQPLPQPSPKTRLEWLTNELYRLRGVTPLSKFSFPQLDLLLQKYLNIVSTGRGAVGMPDRATSMYGRLKQIALLLVEELRTSRDMEKRAACILELAKAGPLCFTGMLDAATEQYEVASGNFQLSLGNCSMETFDNQVIEVFVEKLFEQLLQSVTYPKALEQTVHVRKFFLDVLSTNFPFALTEADRLEIQYDPSANYYGGLAFAIDRNSNLPVILTREDNDPAKKTIMQGARQNVRQQIENEFWPLFVATYGEKVNSELKENPQIASRVRARLIDFVGEHFLSEEEKQQLTDLRGEHSKQRAKQRKKLAGVESSLRKLQEAEEVVNFERIGMRLHELTRLGASVEPLKEELTKVKKQLAKTPIVDRYQFERRRENKIKRALERFDERVGYEYQETHDGFCSRKCNQLQPMFLNDDDQFQMTPQGIWMLLYQGGFLEKDPAKYALKPL